MVPAFILALLAGLLGWARATPRVGNRADRWQYAFAHGIPMFLVGMILMTIAANQGWLE